MNAGLQRIAKTPEMQEKLLQQGAQQPMTLGPDEFAAHIRSDMAKWGKVVKESGATAE